LEAALDRAEGREGHIIQAGAPISDLDKDPRCARLTKRAKRIILDGYISGENPQHQKDPARRGAWLWDCCWEMAEAGMEPPDMVAILKDQRFGLARKAKKKHGDVKHAASAAYEFVKQKEERARKRAVKSQDPKSNDDNSGRPVIRYDEKNLSQNIFDVQDALLANRVPIYERGGQIVYPYRLQKGTKSEGTTRVAGTLTIGAATAHNIQVWVSESAILREQRWAHGKPYDKDIKAPIEFCRGYLLHRLSWRLPTLNGISDCPVIRANGTVCQTEGYDRESGTLLDYAGQSYEPIPEHPTEDQARAALEVLNEVLVGFPFDGNPDGVVKCASRSVALSMLVSPHVAQTVDAVPLHLSLAPEARSGKSLIIQCAGIIATGKVPPAMSWTGREEEDEKRLTGAFDRGGPLLFIDNVKKGSKIFGDFLCAAITGAETSCRRLGHSGEWLVPTRMMVAASGNNVGVLGDLALRTIACTIDAKMPNPGERPFKVDLQEYCRTNRARLVTACLTILRYADPDMKLTRMGGFEQWSRIVRSALIRLGEVDPLDSAKDLREENPENAMLTLFGRAWDACPALRDGWHELSEVFSTAAMQGGVSDLADTLVIILPDERQRTAAGLGRFLATQNGKTFELDGRHVCFRKSLDRTTRRAGYELVAVDRAHSLEPRALAA
jgi:hypothetical protein